MNKKSSPLIRAEIDKDIDKNYIISILQKYKTAKSRLLKKRIHLVWKDGVIDWSEAEKSPNNQNSDTEKEMKRELSKMRDHIDFDSKQIEGVQEQYNAGMLSKVVEGWLSEMKPRDAEVIFHAYINHDYEKNITGGYKTLSNRQIAMRMGISEGTVRNIKKHLSCSCWF